MLSPEPTEQDAVQLAQKTQQIETSDSLQIPGLS